MVRAYRKDMPEKSGYNRLIFATVVVTLIIIAGFVITERHFHSKIEEARITQYQEQQQLTAKQTASSLKDFMEHVKLELTSLSLSSPLGEYKLDKEQFSVYHRSLIESVTSIIRIDKAGKIIKSSGEPFTTGSYAGFSGEDFFVSPRETMDTYINEYYNKAENKTYLLISIPVFKEGYQNDSDRIFDGILMATMDTDLIQGLFLDQIKIGTSGYVWAIRSDGTLIGEPKTPALQIYKGVNYFDFVRTHYPQDTNNINKIIAEDSGSVTDDWGTYGRTLTSYSHINLGGTSWIIGVTVPFSELEKGIDSLQKRMIGFLITMVVILSISFILVLFVLKSKVATEQKLENAQITLKKLGIKAIPEYGKVKGVDIELKDNNMYLVKEKFDTSSYDLFISLLNKKYLGLALTRENPEDVRKTYDLEKTPFIWLKKPKDKNDRLSMINVDQLQKLVSGFISENRNAAVLIERLDYIIVQNGFEKALKFIQALRDSLSNGSIIILSLNPMTLNESQLNLIEAEAKDISNLVKKDDTVKLDYDVYEILRYVDIQNRENKIVSFKIISKQFNITKPTTKKKLDLLRDLKLIEIRKHGRDKNLYLSEKGKKLLENR